MPSATPAPEPFIPHYANWVENGQTQRARWRSENHSPPPKRILIADDTTTADAAFQLVNQGNALLWRGDYHNAVQLLNALARRIDKRKAGRKIVSSPREAFNMHRLMQAQRARLLNAILIELDADFKIALRRAPDVQAACQAVFAQWSEPALISLRALQGMIGAHEWRKKGIAIPALSDVIHVSYGIFSPIRGEYIDLVANAPLPEGLDTAFDIGTGSGVLAAVLIKRGVRRVVATDSDPRAIQCARDNFTNLGIDPHVELQLKDLFPEGKSALIVCNPPWIPARPTSPIERAIYDPDNQMLLGFLSGLRDHLTPQGEAWLIMSDLAEHLGLRDPDYLSTAFDEAGLRVLDRLDARPKHPKSTDETDPLFEARRLEVTSLWRLGLKSVQADN